MLTNCLLWGGAQYYLSGPCCIGPELLKYLYDSKSIALPVCQRDSLTRLGKATDGFIGKILVSHTPA
jgi:hypothetical protein